MLDPGSRGVSGPCAWFAVHRVPEGDGLEGLVNAGGAEAARQIGWLDGVRRVDAVCAVDQLNQRLKLAFGEEAFATPAPSQLMKMLGAFMVWVRLRNA